MTKHLAPGRFVAAAVVCMLVVITGLPLMVLPPAHAAGIQNIQTKGASTLSTGATSLAVSVAPTGAGNLLVVGIFSQAVVSSIEDGKDTFALAGSRSVAGEIFAVYYAKNIAGGSTSVTAKFSFGTADMIVSEYAGIDTAAPFDVMASQDNGFVAGTTYSSGATAQTAQASELLWGFSANAYGDVPVWTPTGGSRALMTTGNAFAEEQIATAQGSYAASGSITNVSSNYRIVSFVVAFKGSGAAVPTLSTPPPPSPLPPPPPPAPTPDTTPPSVLLTAPASGATVSGSISITASATDNVGVVGVQFKLDAANLGSEATAAPYAASWNTTGVANGAHALSATARDAAGNTAGVSITVNVSNSTLPPPSPLPPPPPPTPAPTPSSGSGAPTIFYSDITSGPKSGGENNNGAYVTLFGNFGSSPTVTVGGGPVYVTTQPTTWLWYQKMTIQLGPNAATGNIVVKNVNGTSNGVPFTVRNGGIFCVSTNGNDGNNGRFMTDSTAATGTKGCWLTLNKAKDSIAAGDIAYAMNGVAVTSPECPFTAYLCMDNNGGDNSGTASNPKALIAYPGAVATIGQTGAGAEAYGLRTPNIGAAADYWVISQFIIRGNTQANDIGGEGWRFVGNDLSAGPGDSQVGCSQFSTGDLAGTGPMMYYYGNNVHGCGPSPASIKNYHAVYFSTDTNHVDAAWNYIHDNFTCRAMQFHSSPTGANTNGFDQYDIHVHHNVIHDDNCNGINFATIDPSKGTVEAYDNLIYNTGLRDPSDAAQPDGSCIYSAGITNNGSVGKGMANIYNNTFYNCAVKKGNGATIAGYNNTGLAFRLTNNIVYQPSGQPFVQGTSPISGTNDLFFGLGTNGTLPAGIVGSITTDPMFVAPGVDFHLTSASPAIDKGIVPTAGAFDLDGGPRPQSSAYDLGAYEFNSGVATTVSPLTLPPVPPLPSPTTAPFPTAPAPATASAAPAPASAPASAPGPGSGSAPGSAPAPTTSPTTAPASLSTPVTTAPISRAGLDALLATLESLARQARLQGISLSPATELFIGSMHAYKINLARGSLGADVEALQMFLIGKATGPAASALAATGVSGFFGKLTVAALIEYQKSVGLPATGQLDTATRTKLNALHGA